MIRATAPHVGGIKLGFMWQTCLESMVGYGAGDEYLCFLVCHDLERRTSSNRA